MSLIPNYLVCPGCHSDEGFHKHPDAPDESNTAICEACGNRVLFQPDSEVERAVGDPVYIVEHSIAYEGIINVEGPFVSLERAEKNGTPDHAYHRADTEDPWIYDSGKKYDGDTYTIKKRTLR